MFSCNGLVLNYAIIMYNKSKSKNEKIKMDKVFPDKVKYDILPIWENHRAKGGFTPLFTRRVQVALQAKDEEG